MRSLFFFYEQAIVQRNYDWMFQQLDDSYKQPCIQIRKAFTLVLRNVSQTKQLVLTNNCSKNL